MNKKIFLIIISGITLALSMPPFSLWPLAFLCLVPLYFVLDGASRKESFYYSWLFGCVFFIATLYWVIHSMYYFGGIPLLIGFPLMIALAVAMGLYFACYGYLYSLCSTLKQWQKLILGGGLWVSFEYLRTILFTGFPWVLLGYSQKPFLYFTQIADITGVYGISFAIVVVNIALYNFLFFEKGELNLAVLRSNAMPIGIFLFILIYGAIKVAVVGSEISKWSKVNMAVAQGNIPQEVKWDPAFKEDTVNIYKRLTKKASEDGAELVLWPEAATPFFLESRRDRLMSRTVKATARENNISIITGSLHSTRNSITNETKYFNSAFAINNSGNIKDRYDKVHLVPLGEYVPLKLNEVFPFIKKLTVGVGDFSEGNEVVPLPFVTTLGITEGVGVSICYEVIFPEISRQAVLNGATVLSTITNDAWFGEWSAPYQHFEMASFRAIENRVYMLRSANTGISGVFDPLGRELAKTELFTETVLTVPVGLKRGSKSFYTLYGDLFAYLCIIVSVGFLSISITRKKQEKLL